MNRIFKYALIVMLTAALGSCNIYKKYELPTDTAITSDYKKALDQQKDSTSLPYLSWEQVFTDPLLQNLIRQALDNNSDLKNARLNVDIANAQLQGAKLSYFPSAVFNPNVNTATYGGSHMNWTYQIPIALNWEIDAFAKILNRKRGAKVNVEQAEAYRQAAQSRLICGVANTYYTIVLLKQQLGLTRRTSEIWKEQAESMELMKKAARMTEAAVVQSRANYYNIMASIPDLERQLHVAQNAMSLLLNTYPQTWEVTSDLNFDIPEVLVKGVPLNYLAARPDVYAAERSLAAAYYATNSARAAFYPSLSISSNGGFTNLIGSFISNPGKWFVQLAGQLAAPLFSRGQNIAGLKAAKAQQQQALNNFEYSVLSAAGEVSNAMVELKKNSEKREMLVKEVEQWEKAVEYNVDLLNYDPKTTYLEVLTARSGLLNSQMSSLACWHSKVQALISLYQAAGGGR